MKSKLAIFLTTLSFSVMSLSGAMAYAAGNGSLTLSPNSGTENMGSTFSMGVYENGNGSPVNVVTADLSYDQGALQIASVACGGAFSSPAQTTGANGSVTLSCFTPGGSTAPTDNQLVGTVSFKALAGSGSTAVTFGSGSIMASNGNNVWDGNPNGGTYTLNTPAPAAGRGAGSGSPSTGAAASTPSSTTKSTTPVATSSTAPGSTLGATTSPAPTPVTTPKAATPKPANITTQSTATIQPKSSNVGSWIAYTAAGIIVVLGASYYAVSKYKPELLAKILEAGKTTKG